MMDKEGGNNFWISVSDKTLIECDSKYKNVIHIMSKEDISPDKWMIRSNVGITSQSGYVEMICHFYNDGKVYIAEYSPAHKDPYYNIDLVCLSQWLQSNGWNRPSPLITLIEEMVNFWKVQWETFLIDSEHFDKKFGCRKIIEKVDYEE